MLFFPVGIMRTPDSHERLYLMPVALPWAMKQLLRTHEARPELVDRAITTLLESDSELKWSIVLGAYIDQEINIGKAAELLGLHELELRERFRDLGVPLRVGSADLAEARAEVNALEAWFAGES